MQVVFEQGCTQHLSHVITGIYLIHRPWYCGNQNRQAQSRRDAGWRLSRPEIKR
jgi:hypothetical protein